MPPRTPARRRWQPGRVREHPARYVAERLAGRRRRRPHDPGFLHRDERQRGQTVTFKIKTPASSYHIDILRLGYYQGNGARKLATSGRAASLPQTQPACLTDASTGLIDCGNWGVSASWAVPATASRACTSRTSCATTPAAAARSSFVVRDDASHSDIVIQTSDTTWQAYNTYGGNSLYSCTVNCPAGNPVGYKGAQGLVQPAVRRPSRPTAAIRLCTPSSRWCGSSRRNGYDVATSPGRRRRTRRCSSTTRCSSRAVTTSTGRVSNAANVEAARDAGVNLAFFSGNEVFWKTRWEPIDGSNTPYARWCRTRRRTTTRPSTRRPGDVDGHVAPTHGSARRRTVVVRQNALTGQFFIVNAGTSDIKVPSPYEAGFWRNTGRAAHRRRRYARSGHGTLGYEWDADVDNGFRPAGLHRPVVDDGQRLRCSSTTAHRRDSHRDAPPDALPGAERCPRVRRGHRAVVVGPRQNAWDASVPTPAATRRPTCSRRP